MKLDGKFAYLKENQRTLSFNVDIVRLPRHKTVFTGSSSEFPPNIQNQFPLKLTFHQATTVCTDLRLGSRGPWAPTSWACTYPPPCSSWCPGSHSLCPRYVLHFLFEHLSTQCIQFLLKLYTDFAAALSSILSGFTKSINWVFLWCNYAAFVWL